MDCANDNGISASDLTSLFDLDLCLRTDTECCLSRGFQLYVEYGGDQGAYRGGCDELLGSLHLGFMGWREGKGGLFFKHRMSIGYRVWE